MSKMVCAITGAAGYVGLNISAYLSGQGFTLYHMGRKPMKGKEDFFIPFFLGKDNDYSSLRGVDVLIHCAYDFSAFKDKNSNANISGTMTLFEQAKKYGVKQIIFISSMAAFPGAKSHYGKTKLYLENIARQFNAVIIRPGLIFGRDRRGILGVMEKFVERYSIVPLIGKGQYIFYPCHVEDLSHLIFRIIREKKQNSFPWIAAANQPLSLKQIIQILAKAKNKKILLLPIPYVLLYSGLVVLETVRVNVGFRSDSLVSVRYSNPSVNFQTSLIDVPFRNLTVETLVAEKL